MVTFGIFNINEARKSCEISYGIGKRYQSKGYFQNVLKIVTDEVLIKNNFNRIQATTSEINIPSINGLKKFGFKKEVQIENFIFIQNLDTKMVLFCQFLQENIKRINLVINYEKYFEEINNNQYKALLSFEKINFTEKRAKEMFEYSNSSSFYKYLETSPHQNLKESQDYLKTLVERDEKGYLNGDSKYWFVIEKIENKMIGTVGFVDIDKEKKSACIAIGLSESYRHEGRGIEAVLSLLYFGFNHLNFYRIWLITHTKINQ